MKALLLIPITTLFCHAAYATNINNQPIEEHCSDFNGTAKLGFIYSKTTNTSMSMNSAATLKHSTDDWSNKLKFSSYYTDSSKEEDGVNKYSVTLNNHYMINSHKFIYLRNEYNHDQFETYRHEYIIATGLGYKIYDTKTTKLTIGGGPGFRYSKRQLNDLDHPSQIERNIIANAFLNAEKHLTSTLTVGANSGIDYGVSNTNYSIDGYIKNKLIGDISLLLDSQYIYNTEVASDKSHSEIYSTVSLTYDF